ncbi:MAG: hypothetical protein ACK6CT_03180 [Planctomycetia bacterium]
MSRTCSRGHCRRMEWPHWTGRLVNRLVSRLVSRRLTLLVAWLASAGIALPVHAAGETDTASRLLQREEELRREYAALERSLLRLADLLATTDPRRSAALRTAFEKARESRLDERLSTIVALLEKRQYLKAGSSQQEAIDQMRGLLELLESGDSERRAATMKEEVRGFLARLCKAVARQRDIEGSTEAGGRPAELAERQAALAGDVRSLSDDVDRFARRADERSTPPGDAGKPSPRNGGSPQGDPGRGGPGQDGQPDSSPPAGPDGDGDASHDAAAGDGDDDAARARRTARRLTAAEQRMQAARDRLAADGRAAARRDQERAVEELATARSALEELLRQMREQEVERLLVQLGARLREMLRVEREVLAGIDRLAAAPGSGRERELESARLGREQAAVGTEATKAVALLRDDGSAVAIPQALEGIRDDATQAAARLARGAIDGTTRSLCQDLVAGLEELLAAVERAAAQDRQAKEAGGMQGGGAGQRQEQPLVDKLAELKMIRSLQGKVNARTKKYAQLLADGAERAEEPELVEAIRRLAERQRSIERAAQDIVSGRTEP